MDKKYVTQAFGFRLKGRFDVLLAYYGEKLFHLPAIIVVAQIKGELGISIPEHSIYTLKKRLKKKRTQPSTALPADIIAAEQVPAFQALSERRAKNWLRNHCTTIEKDETYLPGG